MAFNNITGKPGTLSGFTASPVEVFYGSRPTGPGSFIPGPLTLDGTYSGDVGNSPYVWMIRAGNLVHKDTTSGKYRTTIIGALGTAMTSATVTSITATANVVTEVARLIAAAAANVTLGIVGPPTANGTNALTSVVCSAASGTTLTVTSVAVPAVIAGGFVTTLQATSTTDTAHGPNAPSSILCDLWGKQVTDSLNTNRIDVFEAQLYCGQGIINESTLINWPTDTSLQAWIKAGLRVNYPAVFRVDIANS